MKTWLRSDVAVAVAWASGYSSDSTPGLGTSICRGSGPRDSNNNNNNNKKTKRQKIKKIIKKINPQIASAGGAVEKREPSCTAGGN